MSDAVVDAPAPDAGSLRGRVAIVTGAGSREDAGIGNGRAASVMLARRGADLVLVDSRADWAAGTQALVEREGGRCVFVEADVATSEGAAEVARRTLEAFGRIDVLVNNVGLHGPPGTAVEMDEEAWAHLLQVNVTSMMLMAKHCIPEMARQGGGAIINIASVSGLEGGHPNLAYPTSKGAVVNLTRAMAAHHGPQGVRVNCIAPGMVYTPMVATRGMSPALRQARLENALLPVEGTGWDVGLAVAWLATDEARWITGVVLPVDGGATAARKGKPSPQ
ncbi:MAG: SDR family oxidoreductase [bacterium]|jgi:NAD(P)-dependent dehydrogenase (short-subunit alcohol dehydrogenase family)|nr:SDR family oxidoreductase [bacterium]